MQAADDRRLCDPSYGSDGCVLRELLPDVLQFLSQDLEQEQLTDACSEKRRALLQQLSLFRIAQCGGPSQAVKTRRSQPPPPVPPHQQQQQSSATGFGGFLTDAMFNRRSQLIGTSRGGKDLKNRKSLPPQAFSNFGFTFDKHEAEAPLNESGKVGHSFYLINIFPLGRNICVILYSFILLKYYHIDNIFSDYETPISMDLNGQILLPGRRSAGGAAAPGVSSVASAPSICGALHHRHEDTCRWQSYPLCQLMPAGSRLLLYKSSRATGSPSLTLLLAGYTAIYVERESSANHVIKLTHPSLPTHALSADSEDEARAWVAKINLLQQLQNLQEMFFPGFSQEPDSGFSGPVSSSSTDSCDHQQQRKPKLTKSTTFSGLGQHHADDGAMLSAEASAAASAAAHSRQHSGGFMRRLRSSFGAGSSNRRNQREAAAAAAAAEADAALGTDDCLVESDAEVRLGGQGRWLRCRARLRRGGRLCLPGVAAEPILLDDRTSLQPLNGGDSGVSSGPTEVVVAGQVVRRRQKRSGVDGQACGIRVVRQTPPGSAAGAASTIVAELKGLDKLALGEWIKHMALATGMAPQYEPMQTELLDLHSARALVDSRRRASMPERQLNCLTDLVSAAAASGRAPRPLPPLPDNSITSGYDVGGNTAESGCAVQPAAPYCLYDMDCHEQMSSNCG
uniref:PH domain-containing protein n=1 Tax=Macrostomum lignano TaxID=282301 RepID=A0A1I8G890_9PLAT